MDGYDATKASRALPDRRGLGLKSSAANVGARTLSEVHRALELCAREDRMANARGLLASVQREHARAAVELRAWMKAPT